MSDDWIILIPEDPSYIPTAEDAERALAHFVSIAPDADDVSVERLLKVRFFDCGANFEQVNCPKCHSVLDDEWWGMKMDEDFVQGGFLLNTYLLPCCGSMHTLHELGYRWPQGFGKFGLEAMNPNLGLLEPQYREDFERILGARLRVIYQHI